MAAPLREQCRIPSGGRTESGKVRVGAKAGKQSGRIARWQLRDLGVAEATVARWKVAGYLLADDLPGVYAVGHKAASVEGDLSAAVLYAGEGAMLSHATALWWYGILDHKPFAIDVSAPGRVKSRRRVRVHVRRALKRTWHNGLPVTSVAQALLDYAACAPFHRVRYAVAQAEYHELLELGEVEEILGRGKRGSAKLRSALERHLPQLARTRSELERVFLPLLERGSLPLPEVNATVNGVLADAVWRDAHVVVMLDGHRAHRTRAQIEKDRRDDLRMRAAGYTVLRYTWEQVHKQPDAVLADIRMALSPAARSAVPGSR
jgi:very-short-patch-repair endonuclease